MIGKNIFVAVVLLTVAVGAHGKRGSSVSDALLFEAAVVVDERLLPASNFIMGSEGVRLRPVSRIQLSSGVFFDIVSDEVTVKTHSRAHLNAFLQRWGGQVISKMKSGGPRGGFVYVVKINPITVNADSLPGYLRKLGVAGDAEIRLSNRRVLKTLAVIAYEASVHDLDIGFSMDVYLAAPDGGIRVLGLSELLGAS